MKQISPAIIMSFLVPAMTLMLVFGGVARRFGIDARGLKWGAGLALMSLGLLMIPVDSLPLARWLAGIVDHWSVPLVAILASAVARRFLGIELLRRKDWQTAWIFGVGAGLALYPQALGWGPLDPYALGWQFGPLFIAMAALTALLLWRQSRFGVVLLLAIAAWHLHASESANYWDCLVDPFYFLISLGWVVSRLVRAAATPKTLTATAQPDTLTRADYADDKAPS